MNHKSYIEHMRLQEYSRRFESEAIKHFKNNSHCTTVNDDGSAIVLQMHSSGFLDGAVMAASNLSLPEDAFESQQRGYDWGMENREKYLSVGFS